MIGNSILLDVSVVVYHFRHANLTEKLSGFEELYLPYQTLGELYAGAYQLKQPEKFLAQIDRFLKAAVVLAPNKETSLHYGRISSQLNQSGTPLPQNGIWMATFAMQYNLPLATMDVRFRLVENLRVIFW
jgi:predicted nucleic acid-binding protein